MRTYMPGYIYCLLVTKAHSCRAQNVLYMHMLVLQGTTACVVHSIFQSIFQKPVLCVRTRTARLQWNSNLNPSCSGLMRVFVQLHCLALESLALVALSPRFVHKILVKNLCAETSRWRVLHVGTPKTTHEKRIQRVWPQPNSCHSWACFWLFATRHLACAACRATWSKMCLITWGWKSASPWIHDLQGDGRSYNHSYTKICTTSLLIDMPSHLASLCLFATVECCVCLPCTKPWIKISNQITITKASPEFAGVCVHLWISGKNPSSHEVQYKLCSCT